MESVISRINGETHEFKTALHRPYTLVNNV